jgi:hypothetical protein
MPAPPLPIINTSYSAEPFFTAVGILLPAQFKQPPVITAAPAAAPTFKNVRLFIVATKSPAFLIFRKYVLYLLLKTNHLHNPSIF